MIPLNNHLFLIEENSIIPPMLESKKTSMAHIFYLTSLQWLDFLGTEVIRRPNLGILGLWQESYFIEPIYTEEYLRAKFASFVEQSYLDSPAIYKLVTSDIIYTFVSNFKESNTVAFDYFLQPGLTNLTTVWDKPYYVYFEDDLFGVPTQIVRQRGKSYYFVQLLNGVLYVPRLYRMANVSKDIKDKSQSLGLTVEQSWKEFKKYVKEKHKIRIRYEYTNTPWIDRETQQRLHNRKYTSRRQWKRF